MFEETLSIVGDLETFLSDYKDLMSLFQQIRVSSQSLDKSLKEIKVKNITCDSKTKKSIKSMSKSIKHLSFVVNGIQENCYVYDDDYEKSVGQIPCKYPIPKKETKKKPLSEC
jgi:hypothetical protein